MNIIGEGFPDVINKQVVQRQKTYGSGYISNRTPEQIVFLNGNTSWCKLVSSVNIVNPKKVRNETVSSLNLGENELAKKFVLFNGVTTDHGAQRAGINYTPTDILGDNKAYGIGGTEFGIRPMMGIQSAEIKHENRGSIRRATVHIKAWNKKQFDIIDVLYLRLGFDILLEWGHSMYYNNKGELQTKIDNSLATEFLNGKGKVKTYKIRPPRVKPTEEEEYINLTYEDFLKLIQQQRLNSYGNYDAMFAKVTNFHWSFMPDGSYDITLNLVSIGDVIESFKINTLTSGLPKNNPNVVGYSWSDVIAAQTTEDITKLNDTQLISLFANKHSIGQWFYTLIGSEEQQNDLYKFPEALPWTKIIENAPSGAPSWAKMTETDWYNILATRLFDAMSGYGTKDEAILDLFEKNINNQEQYNKLNQAYGKRTVPGGPFMPNFTGDMIGALEDDLFDSPDTRIKLKAIWKKKNIIP